MKIMMLFIVATGYRDVAICIGKIVSDAIEVRRGPEEPLRGSALPVSLQKKRGGKVARGQGMEYNL